MKQTSNNRTEIFDPTYFTAVRLESPEILAQLRDDAIAAYQPVNTQELFALDQMVLAQFSLRRVASIEAGFLTASLDEAMETPGVPYAIATKEWAMDQTIPAGQVRTLWFAKGISDINKKSDAWTIFLRYKVITERHHRRAIDEWNRVRALRDQLARPANFEIPRTPTPPPTPVVDPPSAPEPAPTTAMESAPALDPAVEPAAPIVQPQSQSRPQPVPPPCQSRRSRRSRRAARQSGAYPIQRAI